MGKRQTIRAFLGGFVAAVAVMGSVAAAFVPDPPMTTTIAPDTYLRVLCEDTAAALLYIPGEPGEGWLICPEVKR
jgi:hypothetical protein